MKISSPKLLIIALVATLSHAVFAQGDWTGCIDPKNTKPYSVPYLENIVSDNLFSAAIGAVGTVTYGGANGPCFAPSAVTAPIACRIGFSTGFDGSVQTNLDNGMPLTFGYPNPAGDWSYATVSIDDKQTLFGANAPVVFFTGASDRYTYIESINNNIDIALRCDVIADAARLTWTITNDDTKVHKVALWYGAWVAMLDSSGLNAGGPGSLNTTSSKVVYIVAPGQDPVVVEQRDRRDTDASNFPSYVNFDVGQTEAYGLQIINGPTAATEDANGLNSDATPVDEVALGIDTFLLGSPTATNVTAMPDYMFGPLNGFGERTGGDINIASQPAFIQKYFDQTISPGQGRQIVSYYRLTSGFSNYYKPYSVWLDDPMLMPASTSDPTGLVQPAGGYDFRVWIDNTRGFSTIDQSIEMDDVKVTLNLPPGLNMAAGDTNVKIIPKILPGAATIDHVDFHVQPDGVGFGQLAYSVTVQPNPGPTKTISGFVNVPTTPKLAIHQGANLVSTPFNFSDSSWETVLGLSTPTDFQAFSYDATQGGYIPALSVARGKAAWIVSNTELGIHKLSGNPTEPRDMFSDNNNNGGAPSINIPPGWSLIADPYDYSFPLGEIIGVSAANPNQSYTWEQLVTLGYVNPALALYDSTTQSYNYIQALTDLIQPNVGYWVFNTTNQVITLKYPPIFQEFLPGSSRSTQALWPQTDAQWRLQLAARTNSQVDSNNYIGFVQNSKAMTSLEVMKPPMAPQSTGIQLSVEGTLNGKPTGLATALGSTPGNSQYIVDVFSKSAGTVTLTWPNLSTLPKDVQLRLVDTASGITRSLNQTSGYSFTAQAGTTRQLKIQVSTGMQMMPTIGNVVVSRPTRSPNAPYSIAYTLSAAATTSVQILGPNGSTIYSITSGRADQAGQNTVTWNLHDNANRSVAPGIYRVEITADTANGDRVRKIVSLNVTR